MTRLLEHGRYALYEALGSGAAASVHLGVCRGRTLVPVAIKRLHEGRAREPAAVARLFDEVRLSRRVIHPNVVSVIDFVSDGEVVLAIMDYVHAEPLSRLLADLRKNGDGRVPTPIAAAIVRDVLRGLQAAHEARDVDGSPLGIVHRDATPENVLVGADGVSRITDFGVAKADGRMLSTQDGGVRGKIAYLAPEQVGGEVSPVTDVYAAGLMLWELLAGERSMSGGTEAELLVQVMNGSVPAIRTHTPSVSARLEIVIARATAKEQERRYPSATAFADALERAAGTVATREEIAAWVRQLAGDRLAHREGLLAQMIADESKSIPPSATDPLAVAATMGGLAMPARGGIPETDSALDVSALMTRGTTPVRAFVLMALSALIVGVGVFWAASTLPHAIADTPPLIADNVEGGAYAPPIPSSSAGTIGQQAINDPAGNGTGTANGAGTSSGPGTGTGTGSNGSANGSHANGNTGHPGPKNNHHPAGASCDPPWTVDTSGIRRYKPECMQ